MLLLHYEQNNQMKKELSGIVKESTISGPSGDTQPENSKISQKEKDVMSSLVDIQVDVSVNVM